MIAEVSSDDVSDNEGSGYIIYVSDRRGDRDDGEYDMEDIYGPINNPNDGVLQPGEDINRDGAPETLEGGEIRIKRLTE